MYNGIGIFVHCCKCLRYFFDDYVFIKIYDIWFFVVLYGTLFAVAKLLFTL